MSRAIILSATALLSIIMRSPNLFTKESALATNISVRHRDAGDAIALAHSEPALADAGPNARPGREAQCKT